MEEFQCRDSPSLRVLRVGLLQEWGTQVCIGWGACAGGWWEQISDFLCV